MYPASGRTEAPLLTVLIPDVDACLELYWTLSPVYFLGDKGCDSLKLINLDAMNPCG